TPRPNRRQDRSRPSSALPVWRLPEGNRRLGARSAVGPHATTPAPRGRGREGQRGWRSRQGLPGPDHPAGQPKLGSRPGSWVRGSVSAKVLDCYLQRKPESLHGHLIFSRSRTDVLTKKSMRGLAPIDLPGCVSDIGAPRFRKSRPNRAILTATIWDPNWIV